MYPYVAPHAAKIHTLITLGFRHRAKPLVLWARKRRPCGFDSHRPLHFTLPARRSWALRSTHRETETPVAIVGSRYLHLLPVRLHTRPSGRKSSHQGHASIPFLPVAIPKTRHSECEKRTSAETSGEIDLCAVASPGTGSPTLRQNAAKRVSSL
jgi:hypothetical protein